MSDRAAQREAEEVPGELTSSWDQQITTYPYSGRPHLRVYTLGAWRSALVGSRHTYPDGRVAVSCEVRLPAGPSGAGTYHRQWWWSRDRMRVIWDGRRP